MAMQFAGLDYPDRLTRNISEQLRKYVEIAPLLPPRTRAHVNLLTAYRVSWWASRFRTEDGGLLFAHNDSFQRAFVASFFKTILVNFTNQGLLYSSDVICDERNNSPSVIDSDDFFVTLSLRDRRNMDGSTMMELYRIKNQAEGDIRFNDLQNLTTDQIAIRPW
jgi:hypothetical protein